MNDIWKAEAELKRAAAAEAEHEKVHVDTLGRLGKQIEDHKEWHKTRQVVLAKATADAQEKLEQAKAKEAEIVARLTRQIGEQSTEELVKHLRAQGITCVGRVDAKDILNDARDIFEQTFWVKGAEMNDAGQGFTTKDDAEQRGSELIDDEEISKFLVVETPGYAGQYSLATGLCAVGGIGLIASMRNREIGQIDTALGFSLLYDQDWSTRVATEALAEAIRLYKVDAEEWDEKDWGRTAPDCIINFNDAEQTDRDDVLARFAEATESPLLTATELWTLRTQFRTAHVMFPSQEAVEQAWNKAVDGDSSPMSKILYAAFGPEQSSGAPEPYLMASLDVYEQLERDRRAQALGLHTISY